jgi:hypothetical protein
MLDLAWWIGWKGQGAGSLTGWPGAGPGMAVALTSLIALLTPKFFWIYE